MLDHETSLELIKKAQCGDSDAKTLLIEHNMPLIKSIIRRYRGRHIEYDDLIQLGSLGLIKAIANFDASYNVRFSTYAVPMITGEIKRFIRDDGCIKVSRAVKLLSCKIAGFIDTYEKEHCTAPSVDEIAREFDIDAHEVVYAMDSAKFPVSLYEKFDDESGKSLMDKIPCNETQEEVLDKLALKDCIEELPDREKLIIVLRYYRDMTQSEIASILGVSQVQVSRLETKIINKMKEKMLG